METAKFYCGRVTKRKDLETIRLRPILNITKVHHDSWDDYVDISEIHIIDEKLFGFFEPGKEYYFEFKKA